jgi:hypothetical protein
MRPVEFGEAVPAGTRLILFSDDKPDLLFTVITFWIDKVSGVALVLETGVPAIKSKTRKAEFIYFFNSQSGRTMKTAGSFGGRIRQALIRGRSLRVRWLMDKEAGVMEQWSVGLLRLQAEILGPYRGLPEIRLRLNWCYVPDARPAAEAGLKLAIFVSFKSAEDDWARSDSLM